MKCCGVFIPLMMAVVCIVIYSERESIGSHFQGNADQIGTG